MANAEVSRSEGMYSLYPLSVKVQTLDCVSRHDGVLCGVWRLAGSPSPNLEDADCEDQLVLGLQTHGVVPGSTK